MITYKTKNTHPGTLPSATIYLGGLLCLSFDGDKKCTVGVNQVGGGHTWKFWIVDEDGNRVLDLKSENSNVREVYIDVEGGDTRGSYVFNGNGPLSIQDSNERRFNLESSWIDLEGPRGHNQRIENNTNTLWPRFYINEGLFCASKLSTGTFSLKNSNPSPVVKQLGPIALEIVADIFLNKNFPGKIEVKLMYGRTYKSVPLASDKRHRIYIVNDCGFAGENFYSDFPLHYKSFSNAFNSLGPMKTEDQFELIPDYSSVKSQTESALAQTRDDSIDGASDRAPCMGAVLGQTSAFKP